MRNPELKEARDRAIVDKFYELYDVKRLRMDDVLQELSQKYFYLDKKYIYSRIYYNKENLAYYNKLLKQAKSN